MKLVQKTKTTSPLGIIGKCLILLEIISMVPLLVVALYNHPSMDDFHYGTLTAHAWANTGSWVELLKAAFKTVHDTYFEWQGTFSGIFIMALQPSVFGEGWYPLGTVLILSSLFIGYFFLVRTLYRRFLQALGTRTFLLFLTLLTFSIQLVPFPRQSYYWYNGSAYYSLFFALALILWALALRLTMMQGRWKVLLTTLLSCLMAFLVGGGNYVTALQTLLVLAALTVWQIVKKGRNILPLVLVLLFLLSALTISILAPGNSIRQNEIPLHPSLLKATLSALYQSSMYLFRWTDLYVLGMFTILMPFIIQTLTGHSFNYKRPWLLPLGSFLLFSAGFAPSLYGMGNLPERVLNINYFLFLLLLSVNVLYFTGWFLQKRTTNIDLAPKRFLIIGTLLLLAGFAQHPDIACKEAVQSLVSGQAKQYDAEAKARLRLFQDKSIKTVVVEPYTVQPSLLFIQDFDREPTNWKNENAAAYYGKDHVLLK